MFRSRSLRLSHKVYRSLMRSSSSLRWSKVAGCHPLHKIDHCLQSQRFQVPAIHIACRYKSNSDNGSSRYIEYDDLILTLDSGEIRLIDVRDVKEVKEAGEFPGAYNIPLQELKKALQMPEAEFKDMYNFDKPKTTDTDVVFASFKSVKSSAALEIAHKLGLNKTRQYVNGYEEWIERQKADRSKASG